MTARFPADFVFGVATSAPQIEGAAREDGRGESIWDRFATSPGRVRGGDEPTVACDHYHLWREDLALMRDLGAQAYRFSVAWPRVQPTGRGPANVRGLDFYERLVDALLEAGIAPLATLYHWDLPQALQDRGGWGSRETAEAFAEYAGIVAGRLGDRVAYVTHNEPWCAAHLGHEFGVHAPGRTDPALALTAGHHLLLSHGLAVPAIRAGAKAAKVGLVDIVSPVAPETASDADRDAARAYDGFFNRWYLDPIFRGRYPEDAVDDRVARGHLPPGPLPFVKDGDLATIAAPLDFLGLNYYSRTVVSGVPGDDGKPPPRPVQLSPPEARTEMGWEVWPQGLEDVLRRVHRDYGPQELVVTENGIALPDAVDPDGRVRDPRRRAFLLDHLAAVHRAREAGVPVTGYYHWSLLDNFEWAEGYARRFGLVHVDFHTLRRTPKESAATFREVVASRTLPDGAPDA